MSNSLFFTAVTINYTGNITCQTLQFDIHTVLITLSEKLFKLTDIPSAWVEEKEDLNLSSLPALAQHLKA